MLVYLPFCISFLLGYLTLRLISNGKEDDLFFNLSLSGAIGLGLSSFLTFSSFLFFNQYIQIYTILVHLLALTLIAGIISRSKNRLLFTHIKIKTSDYTAILMFILLFIPCWLQANYYPYGGWDAWSVWNVKAKFLFLGGENWKNMFNPLLWRSSPHYPLFLPLINVWGWSFLNKAVYQVPILTSLIFTFLTYSLLYVGLKRLTNGILAILSIVFLLTIDLNLKMAISQYCDIVVSCYVLAGLLCLILAKKEDKTYLCVMAGMFTGFLSFTKPEGYPLSLLIIILSFFFLIWKNSSPNKKGKIIIFWATSLAFFLPTILFVLFLSPKNITFINGLTSAAHTSTLVRLETILVFYYFKLKSAQWGFVWVVLLAGSLLSIRKCLNKDTIIIPVFLLFYSAIVTLYYFINTQFEIMWWLQVSLDRILSVILPVTFLWVGHCVYQLKKS